MIFFRKLASAFISPSVKYDEEGKRILASYRKVILLVTLVLLPIYVSIKLYHTGSFFPSDYIIIGLELILGVLYFLLKEGRIILSGIIFLFTAWIALTVLACYADGVQDIAIVGYILIIFLATLLTRIRVAFIITAMSIASVWILGFAEKKDILVPLGDEPLNYSRDYTVIFMLVLTAIILFAKNYRDSLDRINRELQERVKAEEELSKNENSLKLKNGNFWLRRKKLKKATD